MIKIGDKMPSFNCLNQDENTISDKDFIGKKLIIFFYPKDDTPGCTAEACSLRDGFAELSDLGFSLLGVSPDKPAKHKKFIEKHQLPYQLLADTEHKTLESFGVWGEKSMYGRKYMGVIRTSVVIDETGTITHVIDKVKTKDHANQLLTLLKN